MTRKTNHYKMLVSPAVVALGLALSAPAAAQDNPGFVEQHQQDSTQLWRDAELNRLYPDIGKKNDVTFEIGKKDHLTLNMGLLTASRFQALNQSGAFVTDHSTDQTQHVKLDGLTPGLQTPFGDIEFLATYDKDVEVYFDLFLASREHETTTYGHEGFILLRHLPGPLAGFAPTDFLFDYINVKAGAFEIDYGDQTYRRSANARTQNNPLIGNSVVDPETTEIGVEVFNDENRVNWLLGVSNGDTQSGFNDGKGYAAHAKLWAYPLESLRLALSGYYSDHTGDGTGYPTGGTKSRLFTGNRTGGAYSGLFAGGHSPGQVLLANGQKVMAGQFDLTGRWGPLEVYGNAGYSEDGDTNGDAAGTPKESWEYHTAELVWHFNKDFYAAARYSGARAMKLKDHDSSGKVDRVQGGLGFWLIDGLLLKGEYVYQRYADFKEADGNVSDVEAWHNPSFNGAVFEASYQF